MGLFSKRREPEAAPENKYVQVRVTIGERVTLGWMIDKAVESNGVRITGMRFACSVPEAIDGYPVLGATPECMASLYGLYLDLPRNAVFVCLRAVEHDLLSKKFDSDKRVSLPHLTSKTAWKISFYRKEAGASRLDALGGYYSMTDGRGYRYELTNLKPDSHYSDAHTLDVFMNFASDRVTMDGRRMGYNEHYPCLIREDIADPVTVEIARNGVSFF